MKVFGALFCTGMMLCTSSPVLAGFEFIAPAAAPQMYQPAPMAQPSGFDAPMPIIPAEPVTSEALPAHGNDPVIAPSQVSRRTAISGALPMDAEILLKATAREERLVINPYPLQDPMMASSHSDAVGSLEQAMMEETGILRPVSAPAVRKGNGLVERSAARAPALNKQSAMTPRDPNSTLTPMPGEGAPPIVASKISQEPLSAPMVAPSPQAPAQVTKNLPEAVGFGRDLPLALALSQIVPAGYSYSFAQNIDAGTNVSWQGGKPWNVVLDEMLAPSGMKAVIVGDKIVIQGLSG